MIPNKNSLDEVQKAFLLRYDFVTSSFSSFFPKYFCLEHIEIYNKQSITYRKQTLNISYKCSSKNSSSHSNEF